MIGLIFGFSAMFIIWYIVWKFLGHLDAEDEDNLFKMHDRYWGEEEVE